NSASEPLRGPHVAEADLRVPGQLGPHVRRNDGNHSDRSDGSNGGDERRTSTRNVYRSRERCGLFIAKGHETGTLMVVWSAGTGLPHSGARRQRVTPTFADSDQRRARLVQVVYGDNA